MGRTVGAVSVWIAALGAFTIITAAAPSVASSSPSTPSITATAQEVLSEPARITQRRDLTCPTAFHCIVAANPSATTDDGGATWTAFRLGTFDTVGLEAVDCPTSLICVGFDSYGWAHRSGDGGQTWTQASTNTGGYPRAVSCPSATRCVAGGQDGSGNGKLWSTTDGGDTWTVGTIVGASPQGIKAVSCASENTCVAIGTYLILKTNDGGASWTAALSVYDLLTDADCTAPSTCVVTATQTAYASIDAAATWSQIPLAGPFVAEAVACVDPTQCVLTGYTLNSEVAAALVFDPRVGFYQWGTAPADVAQLDVADCAGGSCVAIGTPLPYAPLAASDLGVAATVRSTDAGVTWTRQPPPTAVEHLNGLACSDAQTCVAVGDVDELAPLARLAPVVKWSSDGGASWQPAIQFPSGFDRLREVSCAPTGTCVVLGDLSNNDLAEGLARSADGGRTWSMATVDEPIGNTRNVQCFGGGTCFAVASGISHAPSSYQWPTLVLRSTDSGATWHVAANFPQSSGELQCLNASTCLVQALSGPFGTLPLLARTRDGGDSWQEIAMPVAQVWTSSLAPCIGSKCFVWVMFSDFSRTTFATADAGDSWTPVTGIDPVGSADAVSCAGDFCLFSSGSSTALYGSIDAGHSWSYAGSMDVGTLRPLQCVTATTCLGLTSTSSRLGSGIVRIDLTVTITPPAPPSPPLVGVSPARLLETRTGPGLWTVDHLFEHQGIRAAGSELRLPVAGRGGVPVDAASVVLNVTVTESVSPGFVTAYPCGDPIPLASSVNFVAGSTVANTVVSKVGSSGAVCFFTSAATHLVVDVDAFVPSGADSIVGVTPARLLETRKGLPTIDGVMQGVGAVPVGGTIEVPVLGRGGVAVDADMVLLNVTVTNPSAAGFVSVFPCGITRPNASSVNFAAGATVANAVTTQVGGNGKVCLFSSASTHLVVDVDGFVPAGVPSIVGVPPARLLETRSGEGLTTVDAAFQGGGAVRSGEVVVLPVTGRGGVSVDASSVVLNVTVPDPKAPGFVTVFPCGADRPNASNVNYVVGTTVANQVVTKVAPDGTVCLFSSATADLVVDVSGYVI